MPVWHERTAALVAEGRLDVVLIAQEQHRERTRLWARANGIDRPILWDPFGLTGSRAVPNAILVDGDGVVRSVRATLDEVLALVPAAADAPRTPPHDGHDGHDEHDEHDGHDVDAAPARLAQLDRAGDPGVERELVEAISRVLFAEPSELDVERIARAASREGARPDVVFWSGVAQRLRYDALGGTGDGFARAVEAWSRAVTETPGQYVWRRRVQQYGPRMDQPYDFYGWVEGALVALASRGEAVELVVALTPTELGRGADADARLGPARLPADAGPLPEDLVLDALVVVPDTEDPLRSACVHAVVRATGERSFAAGPHRVELSGAAAAATTADARTVRLCVDVDPAVLAEETVTLTLELLFEGESGAAATRVVGRASARIAGR